jgi:hypothetical protein
MDYVDFDLHLGMSSGSFCPVAASCAGTSQGAAVSSFRFDTPALQHALADLGTLPTKVESLTRAGSTLFEAVFAGQVLQLYADARARAQEQLGLRIRLRVDDPLLTAWPWELMYDRTWADEFLTLSLTTPLVRCLEMPQRASSLTVEGPLRVLLASAMPPGLTPLDVAGEERQIRAILAELVDKGLVVLDRLPHATRDTLRSKLTEGRHVMHFIGHGAVHEGEGRLFLEQDSDYLDAVSAHDLGVLLNGTAIRLVVLNTCESAVSGTVVPGWGLASRLVRVGIPAAIGMRGQITEGAAVTFSQHLYGAIARGYSLAPAMTEARIALLNATGRERGEWSLPVLFSNADERGLVAPAGVSTYRRYVEVSIRAQLGQERESRAEHPQTEASAPVTKMLEQVFDLLRFHATDVSISIKAALGATLEMSSPVSTAVAGLPIFRWMVGKEVLQAWAHVAEKLGSPSRVASQLLILDGGSVVWQSPRTSLPLEWPSDVAREADKVRELPCPPDVYQQLDPTHKYYWRLGLTYPVLDYAGRSTERTLWQRAAFRVLSQSEQVELASLLSGLPPPSSTDPEGELIRGAVHEVFGLYDDANDAYKRAAGCAGTRAQAYQRLVELNTKRAYEQLGLTDKRLSKEPVVAFARQANRYNQLLQEMRRS